MHRTRRMATLSRSLRLLRAFSYEQFRPRIFYSMLARDTRSLIDALSAGTAHALDIREPHERAIADLPFPSAHLPLSEVERDAAAVERALAGYAPGDEVVVYCAGGVRSGRFVDTHHALAEQLGISLVSLPGGVQRWG